MCITAEPRPQERHDSLLKEAFQIITEGAHSAPNALQTTVFPRLLTQDTGLLISTGPGAGRLEAVFIPSVASMRIDEAAHRLFIIGPDGCPLDDYMYRLSPYLRSLVLADGMSRTIWFEEPERPPIARKYLSDGTVINGASDHPFSPEVDVVVMPLTHFRMHFFATGGVHGVPEVLGVDAAIVQDMAPRGLFYFDESYGVGREHQLEFMRMVEFLFAQDLDVVVGTSSLPDAGADALAFLEMVKVPEAQTEPERRLMHTHAAEPDMISVMESAVRSGYFEHSRVILTLNDPSDPRLLALHASLAKSYPGNVFLYSTKDPRSRRAAIYTQLRVLEKEGEGYLLIVDAPALEVSDLDAALLITEPCPPLSLIRRAGRCNRRGASPHAVIRVVGDIDAAAAAARIAPAGRRTDAIVAAYKSASGDGIAYDVAFWKNLIG